MLLISPRPGIEPLPPCDRHTTAEADGCLRSCENFSVKVIYFLLLRNNHPQLFLYGKRTAKNYQFLPGGESNPGLPRDRRGYSPLYYRGNRCLFEFLLKFFTQSNSFPFVKNITISKYCYVAKNYNKLRISPRRGIEPLVSRVTGGDTVHYTTEETNCYLESF